ncbi:MAG TPA: FAD-dependent oxidoreductase [Polyangiaceae bacterium]|nr:FAD-dependent oxidoreductase [Polyangiaceae bacterium]
MALPPAFEARHVGSRALTPNVREIVFERVDGRPMLFEAGQWVNAILPIGTDAASELKRSYSIASAPDGSSRFAIAVTRVPFGPGSTWLHRVEPGAVLRFVGPQGFFTRPAASAAPSLMIATGTGVTPLRSMMQAAIAAGSRAPMWLLLGVRGEEDLLYGNELRALADAHSFVRFEPTLSRPDPAWTGRRGYVQAHVRSLWRELELLGDSRPHAFICGLQRMVGSVRDLLRQELGATRDQVQSERYD